VSAFLSVCVPRDQGDCVTACLLLFGYCVRFLFLCISLRLFVCVFVSGRLFVCALARQIPQTLLGVQSRLVFLVFLCKIAVS
jgi:hypothetical protein